MAEFNDDDTSYLGRILTPLVVKSGLICLGAQLIFHFLFAYILPKGPWTELPSFTAHQAVCLPLMIYITYQGFLTWFFRSEDLYYKTDYDNDDSSRRIFGISPGGSDLGHVVFGMMLFWDIPVGLMTPALQDVLMLMHHIGMLYVSSVVVGVFSNGHSVGSYYASFFFGVIECSSIFLSIVDIFHPKHKAWFDYLETLGAGNDDQNKTLGNFLRGINETCRILFALSYLVLRTFYFPRVIFSTCLKDFWHAAMLPEDKRHNTSSFALLGVWFLSLLFTMLQIYWGTLVARQAAKAIGFVSSTTSAAAPAVVVDKKNKTNDKKTK